MRIKTVRSVNVSFDPKEKTRLLVAISLKIECVRFRMCKHVDR